MKKTMKVMAIVLTIMFTFPFAGCGGSGADQSVLDRLTQLQEEIDGLKDGKTQLENKNTQLESDNTRLQGEVDGLQSEVEDLKIARYYTLKGECSLEEEAILWYYGVKIYGVNI